MAVMSSRSMSAMADEWRKRNVRPGQTNWARSDQAVAHAAAAAGAAGAGGAVRSDQPAAPAAAAAGAAGAGGADATMQGRQLDSALSGFEQTRSALVARGLMSGVSETNIRKMVGRAWGFFSEQPGDLGKPKRSGEIGLGRSLKTLWGPDGRMQTAEQAAQAGQAASAAPVAPVAGVGWDPSLTGEDGMGGDTRMAAEVTRSGSPALRSTWDNAYAFRRGRG